MIGLVRGMVELKQHDEKWHQSAEQVINTLWSVIENKAIDIAHVGSTAIHTISAKPIIDIAVGMREVKDILPFIDKLEQENIIFRHEDVDGQLLFVIGDFERNTRTHHIHIVKWAGDSWKNYINFRDYLNCNEIKALEYENIKKDLSLRYPDDRIAYTNGKKDIIDKLIEEAKTWRRLSKTVIFDMDGLMFDTERVFIEAWDYAGEKAGIGKAGYMTLKTLGMNIAMSKDVWIKEFGDKYNESDIRKYTKEFLKDYYLNNDVPVKKGLRELLEFLRKDNYKIAVATSSPKWEVESHLKSSGVYDYFDVIVCGDMIDKLQSKPEPGIYLYTCELLEEKPQNCYALEDSKNGILSAHKAGCKTIMIPDLWTPDNEIRSILFGKYDDLLMAMNYFKGIGDKTE